ncbi:unnamed protein product, partial [Ectocarpus sp. 12 AP-2014]
RGWFPTRQDWSARGIPQCIYVPLEPSTEDRVEAMRLGHERVVGLTLEEDEERLMRIAIRESAAESRRAYEKKYGTEAEREKRREAQAKARVKAMAERESLQRDEEKQLMEVIKASLVESLGAGEKDDRDVIAALEASKRDSENNAREEGEDPDVLKVMAESRRQHEAMQELRRVHGDMSSVPPHFQSAAETATTAVSYAGDQTNHHPPPIQAAAAPPVVEDQSVPTTLSAAPLPPPPPPPPTVPMAPDWLVSELPVPAPAGAAGFVQAPRQGYQGQAFYAGMDQGHAATPPTPRPPPPPPPPTPPPPPPAPAVYAPHATGGGGGGGGHMETTHPGLEPTMAQHAYS